MPARQTATARSRSGQGRQARLNAITLLRADHEAVAELLEKYESPRQRAKADVARKICTELTIHAQIEEEIFYPQVREALADEEEAEDLLNEAQVEHSTLKDLVAQIERALAGDDALLDAKVKVLGEYVKHHVKEEQNELFPMVRKADIDLEELGQQLDARKRELKQEVAGD